MAYSVGKNPFMDDPDDDEFLASANRCTKNASSRYDDPYRGDPPPYDDGTEPTLSRYELIQQQKQQSMNRQLDSTQRCLASIYDSEQTGIATAEELVRQGEQLDNIERKVDKINADTKVSQRHLNSIKSIFGGIRNWWNGEGKTDDAPASTASGSLSADRSGLRTTIAAIDRPAAATTGVHPALRMRSDNVAGFYDDDVVEFGDRGMERVGPRSSNVTSGAAATQSQSASSKSAQFQEYEKSLNANLELMSGGVSQLKSLAVGLGNEISAQNDKIDRIAPKVDRADTKIRDQNRQMRQILGK